MSFERQILGINFYVGDVQGVFDRLSRGGLLVVPAAPALKDMAHNEEYRDALLNADVAIADSAFMVILWNWMQRDSIPRLSGLKYLRALLQLEDVRRPGNTFWIMAGAESASKNLAWLRSQGIEVPAECVYNAPMYGKTIEDCQLLDTLGALRPRHIVVTVGGGTQERLGLYLKRNLGYLPAIHCIGAAIAFLSGDQVRIPNWADRLYLGWLFRCISSPRKFVPRYLAAPRLIPLLWRYRTELPAPQAGAIR
ncbi:WecB/TagA/CpsF family glycosyltransferase [Occallatibacter savannae]|uniref:WecB/TagA/CpsF family glycosyltransferase n=1 Tax=Occallatibacter savannae TaxID=1002691 RepID=UPI001EF546D3|nr:WecB/TagA/CpsF family glycosyltransferase [Occallatibacter savannae]